MRGLDFSLREGLSLEGRLWGLVQAGAWELDSTARMAIPGGVTMEPFQRKLLQAVVREYDELSELEKQTGVEDRALASALSSELGIDPSFVEDPGYHRSEAFYKVLNTLQYLEEAGLVKRMGRTPFGWTSPTNSGRGLVEQWAEEQKSPVLQGQRILRYLYDLQKHISPVNGRVGRAGQVDLEALCSELDDMDYDTYLKGAYWAKRQGYLDEPSVDQFSVDNGGIYITDAGMTAVENDFRAEGAGITQTVNVYNSTVYGSVMATGRDALAISHPALAPVSDDIRSALASIQDVIEQLPEESDERHEALQQLHTLTRELTKPSPIRERAERAINGLGAMASITTLLMPHLARLQELLASLPHP